MLDTYPTSYYNPAYFWPELKVHWRLAGNSPLTGYSQGRIMGGGSSVMGMVALRGTPDDYAEWESLGAKGWGWNDVLPFFKKLEKDFDYGGELHGDHGPVPVRRVPKEQWPPLSKVLEGFAAERQFPTVMDMNADFRDGYAVVPISNWPNKRASSAICYLDAGVRSRPNLTVIPGATATGIKFDGTKAVGVTAEVAGQAREFSGNEIVVSLGGIHSSAMLMRNGIGPAAHLREHGITVRGDLPGVGANLSNHSLLFIGFHLQARGAAVAVAAHALGDGAALFLRRAGLPAHRHVHQRAEQDLVERARPADRQPRAVAVEAARARPRRAALGRSAPRAAGGNELRRPRGRPEAADAGLPPRRRDDELRRCRR